MGRGRELPLKDGFQHPEPVARRPLLPSCCAFRPFALLGLLGYPLLHERLALLLIVSRRRSLACHGQIIDLSLSRRPLGPRRSACHIETAVRWDRGIPRRRDLPLRRSRGLSLKPSPEDPRVSRSSGPPSPPRATGPWLSRTPSPTSLPPTHMAVRGRTAAEPERLVSEDRTRRPWLRQPASAGAAPGRRPGRAPGSRVPTTSAGPTPRYSSPAASTHPPPGPPRPPRPPHDPRHLRSARPRRY